ncbi:MAG: cupin region [Hyphomonadaceae bacterium]|nr:MAG: cupin region [Hyphomonadaceae bacterium]KAF0183823.1 MAG: cupin region [Hyphomonadaceae bacterium]
MKPILNINEAELEQSEKGTFYQESFQSIGRLIGAKKLGYGVSIVPPGKRACPFHNHHVNEEMFFIIEGEGTYRFGDAQYKIKRGDLLAAPAGGQETAHQIINTGATDLKYLSVSTMESPDICEYPDSGKINIMVGTAPGGDKSNRRLQYITRMSDNLDYWDGEPID